MDKETSTQSMDTAMAEATVHGASEQATAVTVQTEQLAQQITSSEVIETQPTEESMLTTPKELIQPIQEEPVSAEPKVPLTCEESIPKERHVHFASEVSTLTIPEETISLPSSSKEGSTLNVPEASTVPQVPSGDSDEPEPGESLAVTDDSSQKVVASSSSIITPAVNRAVSAAGNLGWHGVNRVLNTRLGNLAVRGFDVTANILEVFLDVYTDVILTHEEDSNDEPVDFWVPRISQDPCGLLEPVEPKTSSSVETSKSAAGPSDPEVAGSETGCSRLNEPLPSTSTGPSYLGEPLTSAGPGSSIISVDLLPVDPNDTLSVRLRTIASVSGKLCNGVYQTTIMILEAIQEQTKKFIALLGCILQAVSHYSNMQAVRSMMSDEEYTLQMRILGLAQGMANAVINLCAKIIRKLSYLIPLPLVVKLQEALDDATALYKNLKDMKNITDALVVKLTGLVNRVEASLQEFILYSESLQSNLIAKELESQQSVQKDVSGKQQDETPEANKEQQCLAEASAEQLVQQHPPDVNEQLLHAIAEASAEQQLAVVAGAVQGRVESGHIDFDTNFQQPLDSRDAGPKAN